MLDVAGGGGMTFLPAERGRGDEGRGLTFEFDAGEGRDGRGVTFRSVEVGGFTRAPAALAGFLGDDEGGGDAFGE